MVMVTLGWSAKAAGAIKTATANRAGTARLAYFISVERTLIRIKTMPNTKHVSISS